MCLGVCQCACEFVPWAVVVVVPVVGCFLGVDAVLRLSLTLCLHCLLVGMVPRAWFGALPCIQGGLLAVLVMLPVGWIPGWGVWAYGWGLRLLEPLLLVMEGVLLQNVAMRVGQRLAERIDNDETPGLCKAAVILASATCYALTASTAWELHKASTPLQSGVLLVVFLLILAVHNMFWMAREGVISDAAFCSLVMVGVVGAMCVETDLVRHPLTAPSAWSRNIADWRPVDLIVSVLNAQTGSRALSFLLGVVVTPFFLVSLALRLYSIIFIVSKVTHNFFLDEEERELTSLDEEDILDAMSPWRSPLLLKVAIIVMVTQLTALFLWGSSGQGPGGWGWSSVWPQQVLVGRLGQLASVFAFYVWRLYCADSWTWCPWLTP